MSGRRAQRALAVCLMGVGGSAWAAPEAGIAHQVQIEPILDARLQYGHVERGLDAEAKRGSSSLLAEAAGTLAPVDDYNAFAFALPAKGQFRPGLAVVADAENVELNWLQRRYEFKPATVTLGRQRISLDDQRWVGSVGWRQNVPTFDPVRGEAKLASVGIDLACANSQRTVFGKEAGPRTDYDGDFVFARLTASRFHPREAARLSPRL